MNKCILMGNLTKDTEVHDGSVKVARNSMALSRGKDKDGNDRGTDFVNLVGFGKTADFMERFCSKGRRFLIDAHVQTGSYEKDGRTIYTTDFIIDRIEFADSKADTQPAPVSQPVDVFMAIPDCIEEELPFN